MVKEIVLTDRSIQTYSNFGIEPRCRRCGRIFKPGDTVIKTKVHAYKMDNPFFCIEHFYSEITDKIIMTPISDDFFTNKKWWLLLVENIRYDYYFHKVMVSLLGYPTFTYFEFKKIVQQNIIKKWIKPFETN